MNNLIDELLELSDPEVDKKIIKSFEMKSTLCPEVFEQNESGDGYTMKKEINKRLLEITDAFIDFTGVDFFIHDVILTGSLANYNWSEYSDVDLHIVVDMAEISDGENKSSAISDIVKEFFDAKKNVWNEQHDIKIKNFDVEIYVQDINEEHTSSGVYSILNNEWVVEPSPKKETIDSNMILSKGEYFAKKIDELISEFNKGEDVTDKANDLRDKLKKFRKSGLTTGGEYSYENLTFKLLRRNEYIKKLMDLRNDISDKKLSLA